MVSKKDIIGLNFTTIEEYFDYIVSSRINGQWTQSSELANKLSKAQKLECITYLRENNLGEIEGTSLSKYLIETL